MFGRRWSFRRNTRLHPEVISTQPTETWKDSSLFAARDGGVLVNYGADPTVRVKESLPVPHQVATMVHDRASHRNLRMLLHLLPIATDFLRRIARLPIRRSAAAARSDRDRGRLRTSPVQLCVSQHSGEYQTTLRSLRADCPRTFPSLPRSRPAVRRALRSCAAPRSWRRDF